MGAGPPLPQTERPDSAQRPPSRTRRLFLADLHLDGTDTPSALTFRALLERSSAEAGKATTEIYVLGDLFEFWEEYHRQIAARYERDLAALEEAHRAGLTFFLISGNRDFAYGRYVQERFGASLLGDGAAVTLSDDRRAWLEHGDLLCTADVRYLRYRRWVRSAPVRFVYRLLPWSLAQRAVGGISARANADRKRKTRQTFEPSTEAARDRLEQTGCQVILCGHTHRPQVAEVDESRVLRVLPAWCETCSGYLDQAGKLSPIHVDPSGTTAPADANGAPESH